MSDDLKPCPFCGGDKNIICRTDYDGRDAYAVSCRYPECHGAIFMLGYGYFTTKEEAIAAWNTRREFAPVVIHQVDEDRIEQLERERDEVWNAAIHKASAIANSGIEAYGAKMRAATDKKEKRDWQSMLMAAVDIQHAIFTLLKEGKE